MYTFRPSDIYQNYGLFITEYAKLYPILWKPRLRGPVDLGPKNKDSHIQTYLDGLDSITLKHRLAENKLYEIPTTVISKDTILDERHQLRNLKGCSFLKTSSSELDTRRVSQRSVHTSLVPIAFDVDSSHTELWILKPSHEYVGRGTRIQILTREAIGPALRDRIPDLDYVLQPVLPSVTFEGYKWDARHYAVVLYRGSSVWVYPCKYAFARVAGSRMADSREGSREALLTNISVAESSEGYESGSKMIPIHESIVSRVLNPMAMDIIVSAMPSIRLYGDMGYVLLGLDTMFLPTREIVDVSPESPSLIAHRAILIEVNEKPYMSPYDTVEGRICNEIWRDLMGVLLPGLLGSAAPDPLRAFYDPAIYRSRVVKKQAWIAPVVPKEIRKDITYDL